MMRDSADGTAYRIFAVVLSILFFLSYLIPEWATALANQLNFYSNAWDEANYLTHQMAISLRFSPSYWFGENIYLLLEKWGVSGSWQNIIFDTVLPPTIIIFTAFILKRLLPLSKADALLYALLIWFSSVLFSQVNPLIGHLFSHQFPDGQSTIVTAVYTFPAFLRTPNPQMSYLLISFFMALYVKFKKNYWLLVPLPFLYFPVFVGYFYLVMAWCFYQFFAAKNFYLRLLLANLISSVLIVLMMLFFISFFSIKEMLLFSELTNASAYLMSASRKMQLPLILLIFALLIPVLLFYRSKFSDSVKFFYFTFLIALLVCANTQLITGILFAPKLFQSDFAVILAGIMLIILISSLDNRVGPILKLASLLVVLIMVLSTQGFSWAKFSFMIKKYPKFTTEQLNLVKQSPWVLITGYDSDFYAQFFPYALANTYSSLQSIHYTYLPFIGDCSRQNDFFNQAIQQAQSLPDPVLKEDLLRNYQLNRLITQQMSLHFLNLDYCSQKPPLEFPVINIQDKIYKVKLQDIFKDEFCKSCK